MKRTLILALIAGSLSINLAQASTADIETALMNKDYQKVKELSSEVLKNTAVVKDRIQAKYYLGLGQLRTGQYVEARSSFQIVMSAADSRELYDRAALGMIEALFLPGLYQDALKSSKQLLRKSPQSSFLSLIYLKTARIHLKLTQWGKAKEYLQKILKEFPQSLEAPVAQRLLEEKEYFTVQVGSFLEKERADRLVDDLKTQGQYAYIVETVNLDGKKFYRVRVGQKAALLDAQSLEANLSRLGYPTLIFP